MEKCGAPVVQRFGQIGFETQGLGVFPIRLRVYHRSASSPVFVLA